MYSGPPRASPASTPSTRADAHPLGSRWWRTLRTFPRTASARPTKETRASRRGLARHTSGPSQRRTVVIAPSCPAWRGSHRRRRRRSVPSVCAVGPGSELNASTFDPWRRPARASAARKMLLHASASTRRRCSSCLMAGSTSLGAPPYCVASTSPASSLLAAGGSTIAARPPPHCFAAQAPAELRRRRAGRVAAVLVVETNPGWGPSLGDGTARRSRSRRRGAWSARCRRGRSATGIA